MEKRCSAIRPIVLFSCFWIALFLLYLPAARAGWVSDTLGWLEAVQRQSFSDFISRKGFRVSGFYQLTQAATWLFFKAFGANRWAWHILHLTIHALNATLVFALIRGILTDSRLNAAGLIALGVASLFSTSPYVSEVIVWEAAYHFLQGMFFILVQLSLLRLYLHKNHNHYILYALLLYAASLLTLELFYIVPFLGVSLCFYYRFGLGWDRCIIHRTIYRIIIPQTGLLALHFLAARVFLGTTTGRLGNSLTQLPFSYYAVKPPGYIFHLLWGRFLPQSWRDAVYAVYSSYAGAALLYLMVAVALVALIRRFVGLRNEAKAIVLFVVWLLISIVLASPLWFPLRLLITGDRYLYAMLPWFFTILLIAIHYLIEKEFFLKGSIAILVLLNIALAIWVGRIWQNATLLTDNLQQSLTDEPGKITILLNSPASMLGAPMLGAGEDGEGRLMHNLLYRPLLSGVVYDAPAVHLSSTTDSINIETLDERTLKISLTNPGMFWQYGPDVARSFQNADFNVVVNDPNCCYTIQLARPPAAYRLLYQSAGKWYQYPFRMR